MKTGRDSNSNLRVLHSDCGDRFSNHNFQLDIKSSTHSANNSTPFQVRIWSSGGFPHPQDSAHLGGRERCVREGRGGRIRSGSVRKGRREEEREECVGVSVFMCFVCLCSCGVCVCVCVHVVCVFTCCVCVHTVCVHAVCVCVHVVVVVVCVFMWCVCVFMWCVCTMRSADFSTSWQIFNRLNFWSQPFSTRSHKVRG